MYMRRVDGRKVTRLTPGDLAFCPEGKGSRKADRTERQKSAGAIRGVETRQRAPRSEEIRCVTLDC